MKTELLDAYLSGDLRGESAAFIEAALKSDDALREAFFQQVRMDAALRVLLADEHLCEVTPAQFAAGIMARLASESAEPAAASDRGFAKSVLMEILDERSARPRPLGRWDWAKASLVAAATITLLVFLLRSVHLDPPAEVNAESGEHFVAQLTAWSPEARWRAVPRQGGRAGSAGAGDSEGWLQPGRFELTEGVAEIAFTSGARVFLEGPAVLHLERPGRAFLESGRLSAEVPKAASGFVVNTPRVNVVDIGTRFGVAVEPSGDTEVHVLEGVVEVSRLFGNATPWLLEEGLAVRADDRTRSELQMVEFGGDRFPLRVAGAGADPAVDRYLHYRFNETGGPVIEDSGRGMESVGGDASLFPDPGNPQRPKRTLGRVGGGLMFAEGGRFDSSLLDGVNGGDSLTLALWVKLTPSQEGESGAAPIARLVALPAGDRQAPGAAGERFRHDPLWEMSWNVDPLRGKTGALVVKAGEGHVIGSTDLRDGRWHHVAMRWVGVPGATLATHLHLYVDGRLEAVSGHRDAAIGRLPVRRLEIGGELSGSAFAGAVDEVFFTPSAARPAVIQTLAEGAEVR